MPEVVKTKTDADFLSLVPYLIGFRPQNSVVLVGFRGKRTHGALRLDLPTAPVAFKKVATFALGTMGKIAELEAIAVILFTDATVDAHDDFAKKLMDRVTRSGLSLREAWCLGSDGWISYDEPDAGIRSLNEIELSDASLQMKLPLDPPVPELPEATEADKRRTASDLAHFRDLISHDEYPLELVELEDPALFVEQALEWDEAEELERESLLLFLIQAPSSRDAAMLQWASTLRFGETLWENEFGSAEGADIMLGLGPRPKYQRLEAGIELVARLASIAGEAERLAPLSMLAWLHWALGRGSAAGRFIDLALELDPGYSFANLLKMMFDNGYLAPWAFAGERAMSE